jgi:hypothetical protein
VFEAIGHGALDAIALHDAAFRGDAGGCCCRRVAGDGRAGSARAAPAACRRPRADDPAVTAADCDWRRRRAARRALSVVLGGLPRTLPRRIVVVQHLGEDFTVGVAEWLQRSTARGAGGARGRPAAAGTVLVAGGNDHLISQERGELRLHRPTRATRSTALDRRVLSERRAGCGAARRWACCSPAWGATARQGLQSLRAQGYHTIAQDEATCAVYGMPKAAAALNAAVDILPARPHRRAHPPSR